MVLKGLDEFLSEVTKLESDGAAGDVEEVEDLPPVSFS